MKLFGGCTVCVHFPFRKIGVPKEESSGEHRLKLNVTPLQSRLAVASKKDAGKNVATGSPHPS